MIHGEAPFVGIFFDDFRQRLARTMTGFGFDTDQFGRIAGVGSLQSGGVHCDRVKMACLAQLVNVIAPIMTENAENGGRCWAQTIFYPFMYMSQYGRGKVLDTRVECETYSTDRVKAVPYVESLAVLHEDTNELDIFAVNRSLEEGSEFTFDLSAFAEKAEILEHVVLYHDDLKAINTAENPDNVVPDASGDASVCGTAVKATLGKQSWNMIRVKL